MIVIALIIMLCQWHSSVIWYVNEFQLNFNSQSCLPIVERLFQSSTANSFSAPYCAVRQTFVFCKRNVILMWQFQHNKKLNGNAEGEVGDCVTFFCAAFVAIFFCGTTVDTHTSRNAAVVSCDCIEERMKMKISVFEVGETAAASHTS